MTSSDGKRLGDRLGSRRVELTVSFRTLGLILLTIALAWALASMRDAILLLFLSAFLALVLDPLVRNLQRRGLGRGTATTIVVFGFVLLAAVALAAVLVPLISSLLDLIKDLPGIVEDIRRSDVFRRLDERFDLGTELQDKAGELAGEAPSAVVDLLGIGGAIASAAFAVIALTFMTLFLLIDLPRLERGIHGLLEPETSERVARLWEQIGATISRYALGAVLIAIAAGTIQGGTAWLLGAPFPLALALIAGLLGLIPQVGATIGGAILVLVALTQGLAQALIMLIVVLVYQQVENYVLQPNIQGRAADISGFFVVASVVLGASLLGVLGALVAVPITASAQIVFRELTADRRARMAALRAATTGEAGGASGAD